MLALIDVRPVAAGPRRARVAAVATACAIFAAGAYLRLRHLDAVALWVDEAETSINALTILDHRAPVDHYLGLPLFENTLVKLWPDHPEYEFRDISYSDKGLATYHQWLPMYLMAAAFRVFGVEPHRPGGDNKPRHNSEAMRKRTWPARLPAALAGVLLLGVVFVAAREMGGSDSACAALAFAAFSPNLIWLGRQARYYSFAVTFGLLCFYALWGMHRRGGRRDYVLGAVSLTLLFYSHLLTFVAAGAVAAAVSLAALAGNRRALPRIAAFWLAVAAACAPWLLYSGFFGAASGIPPGWRFLSIPGDLFSPMGNLHAYMYVLAAGLAAALLGRAKGLVPRCVSDAFDGYRRAIWFLLGCGAVSYIAFFVLLPAPSHFLSRVAIPLMGPAVMLFGIVSAGWTRALTGSRRPLVACGVALLLLGTNGRLRKAVEIPAEDGQFATLERLADDVRRRNLPPGSRLYTTPNQHLVFTYYMGLPWQSVAPVRKSFFDSHPGPILFATPAPALLGQFRPRIVRQNAAQLGFPLTEHQAREISIALTYAGLHEWLSGDVRHVDIPRHELSPLASELLRKARTQPPVLLELPMLRGAVLSDRSEWWQAFNYRFSGGSARTGVNLNIRNRLRNSRATLVSKTGWLLLESPPPFASAGEIRPATMAAR